MKTMNRTMMMATIFGALTAATLGGETATSATAGSNGRGPGYAGATADYNGNGIGVTRTKAETGRINFARGLSLGFDEDGLSLSTSYALAPKYGPAVGGTFNMNIGLDGQRSASFGQTVASGDRNRTVTAGGFAGSNRGMGRAGATVTGTTGPRGEVRSMTRSLSSQDQHSRRFRLTRSRRR
jgi:hypothetical protein